MADSTTQPVDDVEKTAGAVLEPTTSASNPDTPNNNTSDEGDVPSKEFPEWDVDPKNPYNWSALKKTATVVVISADAFVACVCSRFSCNIHAVIVMLTVNLALPEHPSSRPPLPTSLETLTSRAQSLFCLSPCTSLLSASALCWAARSRKRLAAFPST